MRRFAAWTLLLLALAGLPSSQAASEAAVEREQLIRGALLYKFAKFVEWPHAIGDASAPLILCILGDPDFASLVARKVENLSVKGHPVAARSIEHPRDARTCHVAYYAASDDLRGALQAIDGAAVLTVASHEGFLQMGGMINLVRSENVIQFEINLRASKKAGLELNARLLDVALRVQN
jgi:hypothetical protein